MVGILGLKVWIEKAVERIAGVFAAYLCLQLRAFLGNSGCHIVYDTLHVLHPRQIHVYLENTYALDTGKQLPAENCISK
jgi:hypothetical protein